MKFSANPFFRNFASKALAAAAFASILTLALPASAQFRGGDRGGWDRGGDRGGWDRGGDRGGRGPQDGWGRPRPPGPGPGPAPYPGPGPGPRPGPGPGPVPMTSVYRFLGNQDHLMTLDPNEGYRAGYRYEGIAFQTFSFPTAGVPKAPIYRCYVYGSAHFVSRDPNCEGQIQEGSLGYVAVQPSYEAQRELVRCTGGADHLATGNVQECYNAGYRIEGVLGYVP
jgi:hypothetical protein